MQIGFVIFPNLTQLGFTGPLEVLARLPGAWLRRRSRKRRTNAMLRASALSRPSLRASGKIGPRERAPRAVWRPGHA
jgi:hypothetical protein